MYAVEFETHIDNGVVLIPECYKSLNNRKKAKIIVMVDDAEIMEDKETTVFAQFLQKHQQVNDLLLPSREERHNQ